MSSTYCSECGTKHDYTLNKPKFCSQCGNSFGPVATATIVKPKLKTIVRPDDDEAEVAEAEEIPNINRLDVDLIDTGNPNSIKLGDLAKQKKTGFRRGAGTKMDIKAFLAETKSSRGKPIELE